VFPECGGVVTVKEVSFNSLQERMEVGTVKDGGESVLEEGEDFF
jgi:hypothetical protein